MTLTLATAPLMGQTAKEVADSLILQAPAPGAHHLSLPAVPEGVSIQLGGADYEQIIRADGSIMPVISEVPVQVFFKVTKDGETVDSKDYQVLVKPVNNTPQGTNPKPDTIPAILQWCGSRGAWTPGQVITISSIDPTLAEILAQDLRHLYPDRTVRVLPAGEPADICLSIAPELKDTAESYRMEVQPEGVRILCGTEGKDNPVCIATHKGEIISGTVITPTQTKRTSLYYGTRTLLQILRTNNGSVPCGTALDFPRYSLRGFMLDIARTPYALSDLYNVVDLMAWYKMNDLHLVINNNYIFHEHYLDSGRDPFKESYTAFRLESKIKGADGTPLTAQDLSYSKKDFRALIDYAKTRGVNIVPEFDTPGHALSFTRVRPDLIYQGRMRSHAKRRCEMLDAANPETLTFMGEVFDEYLKPEGDQPAVFEGCVVHVGADEFYGEAEDYRRYMDGLLNIVLSRGYTPRVWGSLSSKPGNTPVVAKGVQMNLWNTGWMKAKEAIDLGYDVINTNDGALYIVPFANYYRMDKNHKWVYNSWMPNRVGGELLPAGHPQLLGATFAVWNDTTDLLHNGYGMIDIWDIISESMDILGQRLWSTPQNPRDFDAHRSLVQTIGQAPCATPLYLGKNGAESRVLSISSDVPKQLNMGAVGPDYHLTLQLQLEGVTPGEEQALLSGPEGVLLGVMKDGSVGFRRADGMEFAWDVRLPVGQPVKLELIGTLGKTRLLINGQEAEKITLNNYRNADDGYAKRTRGLISTFVLPLQQVGTTLNGTVQQLHLSTGSN